MKRSILSASDIHPDLPAEEVAGIADALDRYLQLVIRIADGALADPDLAELINSLTRDPSRGTMKCERSNIENDKTSNV
jgi:hypothetical protein